MAEHIEYHGNFSGSQIDTLLAKVQSSQVFTTEEKTKLASLVNYDDTEVKEDISDIETSLNNKVEQISANKAGIGVVANAGSKNLYKPTSSSASNMGVRFTVNNDETVSVSGTANPAASIFRTGNWTCAKSGTYVVSGCPEGGAWAPNPNKYRIRTAVNGTWSGDDTGTGISLSLAEGDIVEIQINTAIGLDTTGLVFKPMIHNASIEDSTYVPYAPTNRELYEMILALQSDT